MVSNFVALVEESIEEACQQVLVESKGDIHKTGDRADKVSPAAVPPAPQLLFRHSQTSVFICFQSQTPYLLNGSPAARGSSEFSLEALVSEFCFT